MKKFFTLFAALVLSMGMWAQTETMIDEDFESFNVGDKIAETAGLPWTTFSLQPGTAEDASVTDEMAYEGSNSLELVYGNDQIILFDDQTQGQYGFEFMMFVPTGKDAYFNILHEVHGEQEWAFETYINHAENGTAITHGGQDYPFDFPINEWVNVKMLVDIDLDEISILINDEVVDSWPFSQSSQYEHGLRKLDAIDFYPPTSTATSLFYIDNVLLYRYTEVKYPVVEVNKSEFDISMPKDDFNSDVLSISNTGTGLAEWDAVLYFPKPTEGVSETKDLSYFDGEIWTAIGSSNPYTREIAIQLPESQYASATMGMSITKAAFYVHPEYKSTDNTYIFRVYGQGTFGKPGAMLAEQTIVTDVLDQWIEVEFPTPVDMTGEEMWVTCQMEQGAGEYTLSCDAGPATGYADWCRTPTSEWSRICVANPQLDFNWMLKATAEGIFQPGWAVITESFGSVKPDVTKDLNISFSTMGMVPGEYQAELTIKTNDEEHPVFTIPLNLEITSGVGINEVENASFKVYPNPSNGMITIEGEDLNTAVVYNANGQLVKVVKLDSNTINLNDLSTGVYFINVVKNNGENAIQRIVVE